MYLYVCKGRIIILTQIPVTSSIATALPLTKMKLSNRSLRKLFFFNRRDPLFPATPRISLLNSTHFLRGISTNSESALMEEFTNYLDNLKNYEKSGVPRGAGTESKDGFDLGRMSRLMELLGNPQSKFKAVHIAGTKGKGSTAAFLSNILRSEGYSVGCYTSPHIQTIRERISVGKSGDPVSAEALSSLFKNVKRIFDEAMELENGHLSHFEVFTAIAFSLFAQENVDFAVIEAGLGGARDATNIISSSELAASVITTVGAEHLAALGGSLESIATAKSGIIKQSRPVVLGGPFLPHIERILRDKASSMSSPVVSASDPGNRSKIKGLSNSDGKPCQSCDLVFHIEKDLQLFIELFDVKLSMLGFHQLQNAATATCAALCLRDQGWKISDESIRMGLETTYLLGRSQFLTRKETQALGLPGATILLDGAHTKESAKALADTIQMAFPKTKIVLVVAMANDKDHFSFARELLSLGNLEAVFLTEVVIAGDKSRMTSSSILKEIWIEASKENERKILVIDEPSLLASISTANEILQVKFGDESGIIVITGSLHIASSVLCSI